MPGLVRLVLPLQLRTLAGVGPEVQVPVEGPVTLQAMLDALEAHYPMLRGTLRSQATGERRPFVRFFAAGEDLSSILPGTLLPPKVAMGEVPLRVVGAMAGG